MRLRSHSNALVRALACGLAIAACTPPASSRSITASTSVPAAEARLARAYYWRARPGKLDEYNRYVREVAEPIDVEAQRQGAFMAVTTFVSRDTQSPWTHMRVFLLRDSTQLAGLSAALARAGERLEPDSTRRRVRAEYASTLRDRVGDSVLDILR